MIPFSIGFGQCSQLPPMETACFTFNSGMNLNTDVKRVTVTGSRNGLNLELYLDQKNYMYNKLSRKAGARITINDP